MPSNLGEMVAKLNESLKTHNISHWSHLQAVGKLVGAYGCGIGEMQYVCS